MKTYTWIELNESELLRKDLTRAELISEKGSTLFDAVAKDSDKIGAVIRNLKYLYAQCPVFSFEESNGRRWRTCYGVEIKIPSRAIEVVRDIYS